MAVGSGTMRHRVTLYAPEGTYGTGDPAPAANVATGIAVKIVAMPLQFRLFSTLRTGGRRSIWTTRELSPSRWSRSTSVRSRPV